MRIAVISDVHGNLPALEAVLADVEVRGADLTVKLAPLIREIWEIGNWRSGSAGLTGFEFGDLRTRWR